VQQRGHQRDRVHAQLGQDRRDRERVGDVRVTGAAPLVPVHLLGDVVGPLQQRQVGLRMQLAMHRRERLEHLLDRRGTLRGDPASQARADPPRCRRLPRNSLRWVLLLGSPGLDVLTHHAPCGARLQVTVMTLRLRE
jgi:hypothetical protein